MPFSNKEQITIEKTPGYFRNPELPKRVFEMNSKIKLILIFREPVKRTVSHYTHMLSSKKKYFRSSIEKTIEQEILDNDGNVQIENKLNITEFIKLSSKKKSNTFQKKVTNKLIANQVLNFRKAIIPNHL